MAQHPQVSIAQTIGDIGTEQKALEKIESALVARGDEIDGVICTGYTTTVAMAMLLSTRDSGRKRIHGVGIDTDLRVLAAIRAGHMDATIAQNPYAHGFISCALLDRLRHRADAVLVGSGTVIADDPSLLCRACSAEHGWRVVMDSRGRIPPSARVLSAVFRNPV